LIGAAKAEFHPIPAVRLDYFEIVDPDDLTTVSAINQRTLVAVAAFVGSTRLIDNLLLEP
jgi:pantothenate synthetase